MTRAAIIGFLLCSFACGSEQTKHPEKDDDAGVGPEADAGPGHEPNGKRCDDDEKLGDFRIAPAKGYANISGQVFSSVLRSVDLTVVGKEAGCTLVQKKNPFCDPPCAGGSVCTVSGSCEEEPRSLDLGTVSIIGLDRAVSMEPNEIGHNYFDTNVLEDEVPVGGSLHLSSTGGDLPALDLYGKGPEPLEVTTPLVKVTRGKDVAFAWKAGKTPGSIVRITLNVDQHGNSPVSLTCDVPDNGAHAIPKTVVDRLLDSGVSGFPTAFVSRESVDSVREKTGCVEFLVKYQVQTKVEVAGHTPCMSQADCKEGTCDLPTQTCVSE